MLLVFHNPTSAFSNATSNPAFSTPAFSQTLQYQCHQTINSEISSHHAVCVADKETPVQTGLVANL